MTSKKKKRLEPIEAPAAGGKKGEPFKDEFQQTLGSKIEELGKRLEGQGRNILYILSALVVLGIVIAIAYAWSSRNQAAAQRALGKAIEISQARITDTPPPAGSTETTFKTDKERAEAAIAAFQKVSDTYGGEIGQKAKYFIAINRMYLDKPAAISELQALASSSGPTATLSKFALAQALMSDGKFDQAESLLRELSAAKDPILSKETIDFELAQALEKQGKKEEAADLLFNLGNSAEQAKDAEGKPLGLSSTAEKAKEKLESLSPEKYKQLPQSNDNQVINPFGQ